MISEGDFCPGSMLWVVLGKKPLPDIWLSNSQFYGSSGFPTYIEGQPSGKEQMSI